ncbi:hypothetical protein F4556_005230 [Kitasatospora gansuensis]|uniref:DUF7878 domain-containing protein n=2 Tax=Kitasatospora TaxID=2063 RepID=A0A7W7WK65_9ACTN|nr:hypothetical protein [Kitasatospora gansuensis]MBB4949695.1 hypothetical protein [Kitasatospora gansuensis]
MELVFRNLAAADLPRRGLSPESAPVYVLLLDIEADLTISDTGQVVWAEKLFPVAELACELMDWLRTPDGERGDFAFDSMTYDEPGAVLITRSEQGWQVGSVFAADTWTSPMAWDRLVTDLVQFVDEVRHGVAAIGINPDFIPEP